MSNATDELNELRDKLSVMENEINDMISDIDIFLINNSYGDTDDED